MRRSDAIAAGLCSVTFRSQTPEAIVREAAASGLSCIEWGGDVHVPPGDLTRARAVARLTRDAGLATCSYGSYWRADGTPEQAAALPQVLDAAETLGTRLIRIWAGRVDGRRATQSERATISSSLRGAAEAAHARGMVLACEYHDETLACTASSALRLLAQEVAHPALRSYWQPEHGQSDEVCLESLRVISPWLEHLHVFHWWPSPQERFSLADGRARWLRFFAAVPRDGRSRAALLEFLPQEDLGLLAREARILQDMLQQTLTG